MADAPTPTATRPGTLHPLRNPTFRAVWLANLASNFGGMIQLVGAAWLMTGLTQSATMVALVQASAALPIMILSLPAGAMADGLDRRRLMLAAQLVMLAASAALAAFAWAGAMTPWLLLGLTGLVGVGKALNAPAWQASVGDIVARDDLPAAVALNSMGFNVARSLGPAVGGALVGAFGAALAFAANAASYLGLIAVLARWRPAREEPVARPEPLGPAMVAGLRYVALSPDLRTVLARAFVFSLGASVVQALLPLVSRAMLGGGALTLGLLLGAFGLGAVGGALVSTGARSRMTTEALVRVAALAFAAGTICVALSSTLWITLAALVPIGAGWVVALSSFNVTVQMAAPRWVVGRALSLYQMANFGGMAAGSWLWGAITEQAGLQVALGLGAVVLAGSAAMGRWLPIPSALARDMSPLRRWDVPPTAFPVVERAGPVAVAVEWRIDVGDVPTFLILMDRRRRIRRRDGAHHWELLRDIADAGLWIERYDVPTWADYIRLNNRLTRDDAGLLDRLRALHRGGAGPLVRRMVDHGHRTHVVSRADAARELAGPLTDPGRVA